MNVNAKSHVVGQIVAGVIRIIVQHNLIAIPIPSIAESSIVWRNAEEVAAETKALRSTAAQVPYVAAPDTALEAAMFPGTVYMVVGIIAASVMTYPLTVVVHVRRFRMTLHVLEVMIRLSLAGDRALPASSPVSSTTGIMTLLLLRRSLRMGCRPSIWNVPAPDAFLRPAALALPLPAPMFVMLRQERTCTERDRK